MESNEKSQSEVCDITIEELLELSEEEYNEYMLEKSGLKNLTDKEFIEKFEKDSKERMIRLMKIKTSEE